MSDVAAKRVAQRSVRLRAAGGVEGRLDRLAVPDVQVRQRASVRLEKKSASSGSAVLSGSHT